MALLVRELCAPVCNCLCSPQWLSTKEIQSFIINLITLRFNIIRATYSGKSKMQHLNNVTYVWAKLSSSLHSQICYAHCDF